MKILSFGAGTQSTALALMSCENVLAMREGKEIPHPAIPVYDAVIICNLGAEPSWVRVQTDFVKKVCEHCEIPFFEIETHLYQDLIENYGRKRTVAIPWWTKRVDGKEGKIGKRACTADYKIEKVAQFARWNVLGYKKGQITRQEDIKAHEMHIGFSAEESNRVSVNPKADIEVLLPEAVKYPRRITDPLKAIREELAQGKPVEIFGTEHRFNVVSAAPYDSEEGRAILVILDCGLRVKLPRKADGRCTRNWFINRSDGGILQVEISWDFLDYEHLDI